MEKIIKEITLEINSGVYWKKEFVARQYDHNVHALHIVITQGGIPINLNSGSVRLYAKKPDGTHVSYAGTINADGVVVVNVGWQAFVCVGTLMCQLEFVDVDQILGTPRFVVLVEESVQTDGVVSKDDYANLESAKLLAQAAAGEALDTLEDMQIYGEAAKAEINADVAEVTALKTAAENAADEAAQFAAITAGERTISFWVDPIDGGLNWNYDPSGDVPSLPGLI